MSVEAKLFLEGMRRAVAGVGVVATDGIAGSMGLTISSFASISAEPAIVMVAINHRSPMSDKIQMNRGFALNLLSENQVHIAKAFSGRADNAMDNYQFSADDWEKREFPIIKNCLASFLAKTINMSNVGSHNVYLGLVEQIVLGQDIPALAYGNRQYCKVVGF